MDPDIVLVKGDVIRLYERLDVVNNKLDSLETSIKDLTESIKCIESKEANNAHREKQLIIDSIIKLIISGSGIAFIYNKIIGG